MMRSRTTNALLLVTFIGIAGSLAASCSDEEYVVAGAGAGGAGAVATAGGAGGSGSASGGCNEACCPEACPEPTQVCLARSCTDSGECGTTWVPAGTTSPWQIEADCRSFVCNGEGDATEVPDAGDELDDHNDCTVDACNGLSPTNTRKSVGADCAQDGGLHCNADAECVECTIDAQCSTGLCMAGRCVPPTCDNAELDAGETGIDCGGDCGATCEAGEGCQGAGDCADKVCAGGVCAAASCNDGVKNGDEADVDCGGSCATKCGPFQGCAANTDCGGDQCSGTLCIPNCNDGVKNNAETDVDCGGPGCTDCNIGDDCQAHADCFSGHCADGKCCVTACTGTCQACAVSMTGSIDGICAPILPGQSASCNHPRPVSITGGWHHTCALLSDGKVKCWGENAIGTLGYGDQITRGDQVGEMGSNLPSVDLGTGKTAIAIASGRGFTTCAVLNDGSVKCWGTNQTGQLGLGLDPSVYIGAAPGEMGDALPPVPLGNGNTAVAIAGGNLHFCALLSNGDVKCWGNNENGELGIGDTENRGDSPGEMGDALPAVDLGTGRKAIAIGAGAAHSCALLDDHTVKCWGSGTRLGIGSAEDRGDNPGEMGDTLPPVLFGAGLSPVALSVGFTHSCVLLNNNTVKCWGLNVGDLGLGDTDTRGDDPGEMGDALPPVNLGTGKTALALSSGAYVTCAILNDDATKCWGANGLGQLGLGDTATRGDAPAEMGDMLPSVPLGTGRTAIAMFPIYYHTCALLDDLTTKCWGLNNFGQLGLGDTANRGDAPGEMGDALPTVKLFSDVW